MPNGYQVLKIKSKLYKYININNRFTYYFLFRHIFTLMAATQFYTNVPTLSLKIVIAIYQIFEINKYYYR